MHPQEIEDLFDRHVPEGFQKDTVRLLVKVYADSLQEVRSRYKFPEDKYMWGHERRAMFDRDWRVLAKQHPGVIATIEPNKTENFHFTRISAGPVIITASLVSAHERGQIIRRAEYRETYARTSQRSLFGDDNPSPTAPLYAVLIHAVGDGVFPAFADIVFPEPEQRQYAHRIRLLDRWFVDVPASAEETIQDTLQPKLNPADEQRGESA